VRRSHQLLDHLAFGVVPRRVEHDGVGGDEAPTGDGVLLGPPGLDGLDGEQRWKHGMEAEIGCGMEMGELLPHHERLGRAGWVLGEPQGTGTGDRDEAGAFDHAR
jgi:hypothetical protein